MTAMMNPYLTYPNTHLMIAALNLLAAVMRWFDHHR